MPSYSSSLLAHLVGMETQSVLKRNRKVRHPCVCGFRAKNWSALYKHRRGCLDWKWRKDPQGLANWRRWKVTNQGNPDARLCKYCQRRVNHHAVTCPVGVEEKARWMLVDRNGVDRRAFTVLLQLLSKRYV